jgi:hypothetical protein
MGRWLVYTVAVLIASGAPVGAQDAAAARIDSVAWMQGCWQQKSGDRLIEENWTTPLAGAMLGTGRTVRGGKLVDHEFIVLVERDGRLAYEAYPSAQLPTTFVSREINAGSIVFEDPAHDFPQRVGYRRVAADRMLAWIEGTVAGKTRRQEFSYRRVECPR